MGAVGSLEGGLPFSDGSFDVVLALNVLEHVFNHAGLVAEIYRVLACGGRTYIYVPFLIRIHPSPEDFFRYTERALRVILERGGFADIRVHAITGLAASLFDLAAPLTLPLGRLRAVPAMAAVTVDAVLRRLRPAGVSKYVLGYTCEAVKPSR